jgi:hypothetical protein
MARRAAEAWKGLTGENGVFAATYAAAVAWERPRIRGRSIGYGTVWRAYDRDMHDTPPTPPSAPASAAPIPALSAIARAPIKPCQAQEPSLSGTKGRRICIYCNTRAPTFDSH